MYKKLVKQKKKMCNWSRNEAFPTIHGLQPQFHCYQEVTILIIEYCKEQIKVLERQETDDMV